MDTGDTPEQAQLRRTARRLASEFGPATVAALDDATRSKRLLGAVGDVGWRELRDDGGDGAPVASGVEVAIVADALGATLADVAFAGPVLAADLARRAGVSLPGAVVAFAADLVHGAGVTGAAADATSYAVDTTVEEKGTLLVLMRDGEDCRLARVEPEGPTAANSSTDLTRAVREVPAGTRVSEVGGQRGLLTRDDLAAWRALGLALTSADLVGVMRGVLDVTVAYAAERRQFGVPVGSFQAVQHLLAEARCLMEGAHSSTLYASWAVDELEPAAALEAGWVAKAYAARAARTVCESAIQVHGGIGNTWECVAHVYLRRALLSSRWFGDDAECLRELARRRLGK